VELRRLRLVLSAAARCPASGGVPGPRGYVAGQSGVVSSFLMCVLPVTPSRMNESRCQAKVVTGEETCAKRKSTSPCLLAIPAFERVAGLSNRHLNCNRGICLR
jgi:hypothetical protein